MVTPNAPGCVTPTPTPATAVALCATAVGVFGAQSGRRGVRDRRRRGVRFAAVALAVAFAAAAVSSSALAAPLTFIVDSNVDAVDANPGNGVCSAGAWGDNKCTFRAAIMESNAHAGHDTIQFHASMAGAVFELEVPTVNDDTAGTGDYDITDSVTINGQVLARQIIDGGFPEEGSPLEEKGMDRLFEIHPAALKVNFTNLVMREAFSSEEGGAVQNWSPGLIKFDNVWVKDNLASKEGGGINNADPAGYDWVFPPVPMPLPGRIEILNSKLSGNASGGGGAAVNNAAAGTIYISHSEVVDNPGPQIIDPEYVPDPLEPDPHPPTIPAPGVYEPDAPAIVNQGQFDIVGTLHIADSLDRQEHRAPQRSRRRQRRSRQPDHRALDRSPRTRPRPTAAPSTPTAAS